MCSMICTTQTLLGGDLWKNVIRKGCNLKKLFKKCRKRNIRLSPQSRLETRGMSMPLVGLGTWQVDPGRVETVICYALDAGYRHVDTCPSYGNQAAIGATLERLLRNGLFCREDLFISSKLPFYAMQPESVSATVEETLKCLRLDYIDLLTIHFPAGVTYDGDQYKLDLTTNHHQIWKSMENEVHKGTVKSLGLSNFNCRQITRILQIANVPPANLQVEMHLYMQQRRLRRYCTENCIAMTAYAPLGSTELDRYLMNNCLQTNQIPAPLQDCCVKKFADKRKKTPAQILIRHLLEKGVAVVPKSSCYHRICSNFQIFDFQLNQREKQALDARDMEETGRMFGSNFWSGTQGHPEFPF